QASATVPPALLALTRAAASQATGACPAGFPGQVIALTEGVLQTMMLSKLKGVATVLAVTLAVGAAGLIAWGRPQPAEEKPATRSAARPDRPPLTREAARAQAPVPPPDAGQLLGAWRLLAGVAGPRKFT